MTTALAQGVSQLFLHGGFVMPPLMLLSLMLFTALFRLGFDLLRVARQSHPALLANPASPSAAGHTIDAATLARERAEWRLQLDRRIKFVRILTASAPLLGLLGTVTGMLKTFHALGLRKGFETIDLVASGISEALITTETGLSIAIIGLIFLWLVKVGRRRLLDRFESHEITCMLSRHSLPRSC